MPLPCGVLYAFLLFVQVFSPPAASPNLRRSLTFLRDEVSAVQAKRQPLGLFFFALFQFFSISFFLFLMLLLCIFHNFLSAFLSVFFMYSLCIPCFGVYIMEKPAAGPPAGVIVVVMKSVLLRRRPQVFIKRKLNPSGQIARSRSGEVFAAAEKRKSANGFQRCTHY